MSEHIKRRRRVVTKMKNGLKRQQMRGQHCFRAVTLEAIEDSENLNFLAKVAARGTLIAHRQAAKTLNEIVYVSDGKVVREIKGKELEVIQDLSPRKVIKGTTLTMRRQDR